MRPFAIALAAALGPPLVAWWTGRRLARATDDPLLPELLLARERRLGQAVGLAFVALLLFARGMLPWAVPLLAVGTILAALPMRRAVYGDRVGASTWLEHALRMLVGGAGPWLLLAMTPALVVALPEPHRLAGAIVLGLALVAWFLAFVPVWLALHVAAPFDRRDIEPLLRDVAVRARAPMPRLVRYGTPGIHLVNAIALPGARVATVGFSRRLLDTFAPDEIAAVFAHEMAHLEVLDARRVRLSQVAAVFLALVAAGLPLVVPREIATFFPALFPLLVIVALVLRARRSQGDETASDLRAVELLLGDGDALARALVRLHAAARLPRRLEREVEASATHPSLARRVQAIRAAALEWREGTADAQTPTITRQLARALSPASALSQIHALPALRHGAHTPIANRSVPARGATAFTEPPSLARQLAAAIPLPVLLQSPRERVVVALGADRLYWFDDVPDDVRLDLDALREAAGSYHALRYADVVELRVAVAGEERHLFVRERTGESHRWALHPGDVGLAQRALDLVDGQLGQVEHRPTPVVARLVALALLVLAPLGERWAIATALAALLVLWWPARPTLAALGAAAIAEALLGGFASASGDSSLGTTIVQVVGGALALGLAARTVAAKTAARQPHRTTIALALLGVAALVSAGMSALLLTDVAMADWRSTVAGLRSWIPSTGLLAAVGAGLVVARARGYAAIAAGAVLLLGAIVMSAAAVVAVGDERVVAWREVTATVVARQPMGTGALRVLVSPSGTRWAVQRAVSRGTPVEGALVDGWDWDLGTFAEGRTRTVRALQLEFLDDARVAVVVRRGDSLEVRLEPAFPGEDPLPRRAAALPALLNPVLRVDRTTGVWHVAGRPRPIVSGRTPRDGATSGTYEDDVEEDESAGAIAALVAANATPATSFGARPDTLVVASGRVGRDSVRVRRWLLPTLVTVVLPLADGGVLYTEMPRADGFVAWRLMLGEMPRGTLWRLGPDGARVRLGAAGALTCGDADLRGHALCVERDLQRLRGTVVDAHGRVVTQVALRVGFAPFTRPSGGRVAVATYGRPELMLLDAAARRGTHVVLGERTYVADATPTPQGIVGLRANAAGVELVSWRVPR